MEVNNLNRDKRNSAQDIFAALKPRLEENTSASIDDENKVNKFELIKLQEENRKLRETIVELAVELYSRKN